MACTSVVAAHPYLNGHESAFASAHHHLAGERTDAATARRFVREQLADIDEDVVYSATLLTSELVSNAVLHAGGATVLGVSRLHGQVLVTLADDHYAKPPPSPAASDPDLLAESGRGFQIIAEIADEFGWHSPMDGAGKVAWFTLRLNASSAIGG